MRRFARVAALPLCLLLLLFAGPAPAQELVESDGVLYELTADTAFIVGFAEGVTTARIPAVFRGLPTEAWKDFPGSKVPEVVFGEGVTLLAPYQALEICRFQRIVLPDTFVMDPWDSYDGRIWSGLLPWVEEIVLPSSMTEEGFFAFCDVLQSAYWDSGYDLRESSNDADAEFSCEDIRYRSLTHLRIAPEHPTLYDIDGVVFRRGTDELLAFAPARSGAYSVPEGTKRIGGGAFYQADMLESVSIPRSVTSIGGGAFSGCASLRTVQLPPTLEVLGRRAFRNCISLETIILPDGVSVLAGAFEYCTALYTVYAPGEHTAIDPSAFQACNPKVVIYANVNTAGYRAAAANGLHWAEIDGTPQRLFAPFPVHKQPAYVHSADENDPVPLRAKPDAASETLGVFEAGATVDVLDTSDGWARVRQYRAEGYVPLESLVMQRPEDELEQILEVQTDSNDTLLYSAPSLLAPSIPALERQRYPVIQRFGSWYLIVDDEGVNRYVPVRDMVSFSMGMISQAFVVPESPNKRANVYAEPSADSECIGVFYCGTQLAIQEWNVGEDKSFHQVAIDGTKGYIKKDDLWTTADVWFHYAY